MKEIFEFLDENANTIKTILKHKIKSQFGLSDKEIDSIYSKWKAEYMKPKTC